MKHGTFIYDPSKNGTFIHEPSKMIRRRQKVRRSRKNGCVDRREHHELKCDLQSINHPELFWTMMGSLDDEFARDRFVFVDDLLVSVRDQKLRLNDCWPRCIPHDLTGIVNDYIGVLSRGYFRDEKQYDYSRMVGSILGNPWSCAIFRKPEKDEFYGQHTCWINSHISMHMKEYRGPNYRTGISVWDQACEVVAPRFMFERRFRRQRLWTDCVDRGDPLVFPQMDIRDVESCFRHFPEMFVPAILDRSPIIFRQLFSVLPVVDILRQFCA